MNKQPIFVLGAHKSGTSLLRSLLDSHPYFFTVPIETHFFQLMRYWVDYAFIKKHQPVNVSKEQFIDHAIQNIKYANGDANPQGDCALINLFDVNKFIEKITIYTVELETPQNYLAEYFNGYIKAIYYSIYGEELVDNKMIVEKSVENTEFALDLFNIFPKAKFIHIIRNPYANLISMKNFRMHNRKKSNYPWLGKDFKSLYNSYYFLHRNRRLINNYLVIKYEDLVTNPEFTVKQVCQHLEVQFTEQMLVPTSLGQRWTGNSSSSNKFTSISSSRIDSWKKNLSPLVTNLINKKFSHILEEFGYEKQVLSQSILVPGKKELPPEYIANRFLWLSM